MRFNLQLTYWCLVSITIISSCFLFLVVASESSARIVANANAARQRDAPPDVATAEAAAATDPTFGGERNADDYFVVDDRKDRKVASGVKADSKYVHKFVKVKKDFLSATPPQPPTPPPRYRAKLVHSESIPITKPIPSVHVKVSSPVAEGDPPASSLPFASLSSSQFDGEESSHLDHSVDAGGVFSDGIVVPVSEAAGSSHRNRNGELDRHETSTSRGSGSNEWETLNSQPIGASSHSAAASLPDISSENPTVIPLNEITSTDPPLMSGGAVGGVGVGGSGSGGSLEQHTIDSVIISTSESNVTNQTQQDANETKTTDSNQNANDQIEKINDSGGLIPPQPPDSNEVVAADVVSVTATPAMPKATTNATIAHEVNLTAEEVPIPVFSEWAQKQMEAEEKQQLEQDVVNSSTQRKNQTTGSKLQPGKLRTKNYASPDCGAKIIASNSDAQNTGAVLTSSKDEYMLSPCTNRIWFVVELCEAIQAEKIDLANFELFSSSPKNFTVAVSNRFPTRDWSNVGRFIADDKRTIQTFDLHPHLFGKFVRVDIHSHYNSEHFCPVSLFRVYGTSEFEAFETEDRADDIDEYDDDITPEQAHQKHENNLFKSASDAVLSIVKKAAEVLVKTNSNRTTMEIKSDQGCFTPSAGEFACNQCKDTSLAARVNYVLSCKHAQLLDMLQVERLKSDIHTSQICAKRFSVNLNSHLDCKSSGLNEKSSYFLSLLPEDYVGALCMLLAGRRRITLNDSMDMDSNERDQNGEVSMNLTIDKSNGGSFGNLDKLPDIAEDVKRNPKVEDEFSGELSLQIPPPPIKVEEEITSTERIYEDPSLPSSSSSSSETLDINIYNVGDMADEKASSIEAPPVDVVRSDEQRSAEEALMDTTIPPRAEGGDMTLKPSPSEDPSTWDNLDTLLSEGVVPGTGNNAAGGGNQGSQQRIPSGPHSESVFIRLNNRIKALERNMSLSGQYLEELSRRYKKQVEELQLSLTKTVRALEDQNRRHSDQERELLERNALLKDELEDVSLKVHACIILIIFVGSFMILLTIVGVVCYRSMARNLSPNYKQAEKRKATQKKLNRRKSFDDFSDASTGKQKIRRPSEEAMLILKDCAGENSAPESDVKVRQRKVSVFYGRKANRKGEKRSWPEVSQPGVFNPGVEDLPPAEPVPAAVLEDEEYDQFNASESDSVCTSEQPQSSSLSGKSRKFVNLFNGRVGKKSKKNNPSYKRQESAPSDIGFSKTNNNTTTDSFDEKLILDEDEIENFIPGADLAYNEFMPDGPSGYQINDGAASSEDKRKNNNNNKKTRRLSSPAFFKSPFSKSSKKSTPHESTSWEWYRSKKSSSTTSSQNIGSNGGSGVVLKSTKINGIGTAHNGQPSPASSLSEILPNSGQGSSDNSFRILEEAINTSTIATSTSSSNDKR
ncbi:uncharacterized protein LOC129951430 isoform X2 [Eupeodes corollae]|uniref:uncharacterized protein LOC129951430 isoform X2 n=1 Tax=Eupeodes corollae TaxID=290404 RepID=UPI0024903A85|nr:uncharacterized protein LOC129951430 isoform X2 [Eupeodes corollae]